MNDDQFDKELATLYQQRKSQIVAPNVSFEEVAIKPKYSIIKLCSILMGGVLASFGIMALVTNLVEKPVKPTLVNSSHQQVNIADSKIAKPNEKSLLKAIELPPQPKVATPTINNGSIKPIENNITVNNVENVALNIIQTVTLPQLKEPKLSIQPIYKVMPKYPSKALQDNQSGTIKLSYEIDSMGNVTNINILESEVSRALQRSATKALAKWKYNPKDNVQNYYEIIFEFNTEKSF